MKSVKYILILAFFQIGTNIASQEFSFKLKFEDAVGNLDTLILGYDRNATDSVDVDFGEINIISQDIDSSFDVRVTDEWSARGWWFDSIGNYHLKKQIIKKNCNHWPTPISIDIKCKHWPVTASWDSSLFNEICRRGSVITSVTPGGWWDVGSPSDLDRVILQRKNYVTFSANWEEEVNNSDCAYINENQDTISVFWVALSNTDYLYNVEEVETIENLIIYPNPTEAVVHINSLVTKIINKVEVYDLLGKSQPIEYNDSKIDVSMLENGVYILKITISNNIQISKKLIKY